MTEKTIERGYCPRCRTHTAAEDLRGQSVKLGPAVRDLVVYGVTVQGLSYGQLRMLLMDCFRFKITNGEIANVLEEESRIYLPEYERLKTRIRAGPAAHLDETGWRIQRQRERAFAWVMASAVSPDAVFALKENRGKGNAEELLGGFKGVRITDGYAAYKNLPGTQQRCWAHLLRTTRDLAGNDGLAEAKRDHVLHFHESLQHIYTRIEAALASPFVAEEREKDAKRILASVARLTRSHQRDPKKLRDLKAELRRAGGTLVTCITHEGVPPHNNTAERHLRKIVMKRKRSLGSQTAKGARAMEILLSVCWSLWGRQPGNFFPGLAGVRG